MPGRLSGPGGLPGLLEWAEAAGRHDLPWRGTRDPWAVLVSEVMLQQTQVARVVPVYHRFLARFPAAAACAAAGVGEVVRQWAGLGYNRRAVNLHRLACCLGDRELPSDLRGLLALPGIGPYTARAVLAFAYEADVAVVDTNSDRVLARAVAGRRLGPARVQALADAQVPPGRSWAWNSALLDLGATVCTAHAPRCPGCPLVRTCAWARAGAPPPDPAAGRTRGRQSSFDGSDRQGRGRLVGALRAGPVAAGDVAAAAGWPHEPRRAERVAQGLVRDGLAVTGPDGASLRLP